MDDTELGLLVGWDKDEDDAQAWRRGGRREGLRVDSHEPMSVELAWAIRNGRRALAGRAVQSVLPLYLCQDHFER